MHNFLKKYSDKIHGVVHGFDRIILKGHIGDLYRKNGFYYFLSQEETKLKDFKGYFQKVRSQIKSHVEKTVSETGVYTEVFEQFEGFKRRDCHQGFSLQRFTEKIKKTRMVLQR